MTSQPNKKHGHSFFEGLSPLSKKPPTPPLEVGPPQNINLPEKYPLFDVLLKISATCSGGTITIHKT